MKRYSGNGGGFRQPSFNEDDNYRRNAGRGSNLTQPAWQTRIHNGYQNGDGGDGSFGSFGNGGRHFRYIGLHSSAPSFVHNTKKTDFPLPHFFTDTH